MSLSGRYYIIDQKTGRKFCIEPIHERSEKKNDVAWKNGGISGNEVKVTKDTGGSIPLDESIITEENGFKDSVVLPPGNSPNGYIEWVTKNNKKLGEGL